jgi:hypothetical protein
MRLTALYPTSTLTALRRFRRDPADCTWFQVQSASDDIAPLTAIRQWRTPILRRIVHGRTLAPRARLMTVLGTREFQQRAAARMTETERQEFITFIAGHPEDSVVMVGTGGVRKSRWGVGARGKSGGVRVIYYYHNPTMPVFLLTVFAKNERDNLSQRDRNIVKQVVMEIVNTYGT